MPYKARLKQGEERKRKKTEYRVTNARAYHRSLKTRGMISLYFPSGDLKVQFINASPYTRGVSGREPTYTAGYIELNYTFYRLFGWGMRQIPGYMEDHWATRGLDGCGANCGRKRKTVYSPLHHRAERTDFQTAGAVVSLRRNCARWN